MNNANYLDEEHWELRKQLFAILKSDVDLNLKKLENSPINLNKRNSVRSLFAFYEARLANLREILASYLIKEGNSFDFHEMYPLMDEKAFISDNGNIRKSPNQFSFKTINKYVLKLGCKKFNIQKDIFGDGWQEFLLSIDIRHRITHPKFDKDISISNDELETIEKGEIWWNNSVNKIMEAYLNIMNENIE